MIDCLSIVETDKVIHTVETDIVKLMVEIESFGMSSDEFDKETGSSDGLQPKQADLKHPSETKVLHNEDGNPARANIKQALGSYERSHKGVKASANSDIVYFFTSAQDGDPLQDDVRLCLGDDLKKAQDHNQRQVKDESKDHYPKLGYIENIVSNNKSYDELTGNKNVISYTDYMLTIGNNKDNYVPAPIQKNDMMLSVIEQMKSQVEKCNMVNQETKSVNESLISEPERYKDRVRLLEYAVKDGHSEQEAYLSHELYTTINDHNRKVADFEKQVFSKQTQMKDLNNHIAFLKKNFETIKQDSSKRQTRAKMKLQTDSLQQKLNDQIFENNKLRPHFKGKFSEPQMNHNGTSVNTKLSKPSTSGTKLYSVTLLPKSNVIPKVVKKNDLIKSVTSHLTTNKIIEKCTKVLGPSVL
ncbi:hypothetical protein Tco_1508282 [Tanacetum coccineum]